VGAALAVSATALGAGACSGSASTAGPTTTGQKTFAVGTRTSAFVDSSRSTPANGSTAGHPGRSLDTTILYPATGPAGGPTRPGAPADRSGGPYPLIVFAHGFGSSPDGYVGLLERWAAAGYVVAAPRFPLTRSDAPGGPDLADFAQQPGDMSFVVDRVLAASASSAGPLAGMVDGRHIGAAGHSLGGVTVLGLVANSCCRDQRVAAAVVMSGDPISFPTGRVDFGPSPPLLLVHGNADPDVPYVSSIDAYNAAHAPKGLLTVVGGDHGAPVDPAGRGFVSVVGATTDFFDAYLKHRSGAVHRLRSAAVRGATTLTFVDTPGATSVLPVPTIPKGNLSATATPSSGLTDAQTVTVHWTGYAPGTAVNILECAKNPPTAAGDCDLHGAQLLHPDPTGSGSLPLVVRTGAIGTGGGMCDATHPGCVIAVNEGGSLDPSATVTIGISFR
jgi:dienelactone hydrolase